MKVYLLNHAHTNALDQGILIGHSDHDLSDLGQAQTEKIAQRLSGVDFSIVYSSDLAHARYTTKPIYAAQKDRKLLYHEDRLRPRFPWDHLSGKKYADLRQQYDEPHIEELFVESAQTFGQRVRSMVDEWYAEHAAEEILAVTHADVIKEILSQYALTHNTLHPLPSAPLTPGSLTVVEFDDTHMWIRSYNEQL